ncbi:MAG TPA: HEAT repeat domain-containing protein [Kofleriaceae bacterium]
MLGIALVARPAVAGFNWIGQVEADAEGLTSPDEAKQKHAIELLTVDDIHLAEPYLMQALVDTTKPQQVRQDAARALGSGGAMAAVPTMIEWLNADPKMAAIAADVLGDLGGPQATAALVRSLGDPDDVVRQRAVRALGKIGLHDNPSVVVALIPRLDDTKTDVRRETVEQLEQLGDRRAVIPLVARFGEPSKDVSKAAIRAVGRLGDRSAVPALVRMMADPQEDVRTAAVGSLGQLGAVDAIDALVEQLATGSDAYREKVAYALGQIAATPGSGKAGEDAMRTLVENLASPQTRHAAQNALRVAGRAAVPALVANLTGQLKGDPTIAVTLLGDAADARATTALAAELERGRVAIPLVLKALGATGDPGALVPVLGELSAKDAAIRLAAMNALRPLLGRDARAGDVLIEHLSDDDLEVRVLAAEYLGLLELPAATTKLIALAGTGNPTRLRRAAIDALGLIRSPAAAPALIDVLREGPPELHRPAATALSYIADAPSIAALVALARADRGPTRHETVRALAATLRDHPDASARKLLRELVDDGDPRVALAAIAGLAAAGDASDAPVLRAVVERGASDRRRAAAWALGELHDPGAFGPLTGALAIHDDRLVGDAMWALGELAATMPRDPHVAPLVDRWLYVAHHGGWAGSIDATAALGRALWALPADARPALLAGDRKALLVQLAAHKSRLVRIDAAYALAAIATDPDAAKALAQLAHDESPHVRAAAALAHSTAPRDHWVVFQVVDKGTGDEPVRQEPYFVVFPDGLAWATYSDAKGELASEHVPAGDSSAWTVLPSSRESEL